ncbi:MAG TPA: HEAT repeat domain-containing protein [Candidatus Brocadiia bacterium]|nr:HEAT repeat domain-containing protein [Candidatus Brocadiia bacterium]
MSRVRMIAAVVSCIFLCSCVVVNKTETVQVPEGQESAEAAPASAPETAPPAAQAAQDPVEKAFADMVAYDYDKERACLSVIEDYCNSTAADPAKRKAVSERLAAILGTDATTACKDFVCRQLREIGDAEAVPALEKLLAAPEAGPGAASPGDMARYALERMPCPEAGDALRNALNAAQGKTRIGIINSLGERGDAQSVPQLAALADDADADASSAAVAALGKIGNAEAAAKLKQLKDACIGAARPLVIDSYLLCADRLAAAGDKVAAAAIYDDMFCPCEAAHVQIAALQGIVNCRGEMSVPLISKLLAGDDPNLFPTAARYVVDMPGQQATKAFADQLPKLSPAAQAALLGALSERKDTSATPAVIEATKSKSLMVRNAALQALVPLAGASGVPIMVKALGSEESAERNTALSCLKTAQGEMVDAAIVAAIPGADAGRKVALIQVIADRNCSAAAPILLWSAQDADKKVRIAAFDALSMVAGPEAMGDVLALFMKSEGAEQRAAETSLVNAAKQISDQDARVAPILAELANAQPKTRCALLRAAGRLGGAKALESVRAALKSDDEETRETALRVLSEWPDAAPAEELLQLAKNAPDLPKKVLALRGYVRVVGLPSERSAAETLALFAKGMEVAERPEERRMVLSGVADVSNSAALKMVEPYLADKDLSTEAAFALVKIAKNVSADDKDAAKAAVTKVLEVSKSESVRKQAQEVREIIEKYEDFITSWLVAGPYLKEGKDGKALFDMAFPPETSEAKSEKWTSQKVGTDQNRPWMIDLNATIGGDQRCAYLLTKVYSPKAQEVNLEMGSDDGIKVWLNGAVVHANNASRGMNPGEDKVKVALNEGWNCLLMKITDGGGDWSACARIRGVDGGKVEGLKIESQGATELLSFSPDTFLDCWQVSGPYMQEGKTGQEIFDVAFPPEQADAKGVEWNDQDVGEGNKPWLINLDASIGGDDRAAYLRTRIHSPKEQDAQLEVGSDDGIKVWLNGVEVHSNKAVRPTTAWEDKVKISLKEGWNDLLLKVVDYKDNWSACARVRAADGGPLPDIKCDCQGGLK